MSSPRARLPKRLPPGTKYVVEGRSASDGVRVFARYLVLPKGERVDLPTTTIAAPAPAPVRRRVTGRSRRMRRGQAARLGA